MSFGRIPKAKLRVENFIKPFAKCLTFNFGSHFWRQKIFGQILRALADPCEYRISKKGDRKNKWPCDGNTPFSRASWYSNQLWRLQHRNIQIDRFFFTNNFWMISGWHWNYIQMILVTPSDLNQIAKTNLIDFGIHLIKVN